MVQSPSALIKEPLVVGFGIAKPDNVLLDIEVRLFSSSGSGRGNRGGWPEQLLAQFTESSQPAVVRGIGADHATTPSHRRELPANRVVKLRITFGILRYVWQSGPEIAIVVVDVTELV